MLPLFASCDLTRLTANQTASLFQRASPAFQAHWDYEFAGRAAPAAIMQLEGVLRVVPENEKILLELAKAYAGYAYGWIEDELERTDPMDMDRQDHLRLRARLMYTRARNLALKLVRLEDDGLDAAMGAGAERFEAWLQEAFDDEEHAPRLFWAGYAWGSVINTSLDDPAAMADLAFARGLVKRSVELDERYYNSAGHAFLGYVESAFPQALGGNPEAGKQHFERALTLTERNALLIQFNYARGYAVQTQNRELFDALLAEVLAAGDVLPSGRLLNKIAQRRARRLLAQADELF